jgi:hypothetical protein
MKILTKQRAASQREAIKLAVETAGAAGITADIIDMFTPAAEDSSASNEADKIISSTIRSRYGSKATWRVERWFVPIPKLRYEERDIPQLVIEVSTYLVAAVVVRTTQNNRLITLVGTVGKPEILGLPMVFLHALFEKDLGRFAIVARDASYTTWEIPGAKPIRLPNDFVNELLDRLRWQSIVAWLRKFGDQGRWVAPLVAGSLLGLAFQDSYQPLPASKELVTTDNLVSALVNMAYQPAEAREMVRLAASRLRSDITFEEGIRVVLQMGKGEES